MTESKTSLKRNCSFSSIPSLCLANCPNPHLQSVQPRLKPKRNHASDNLTSVRSSLPTHKGRVTREGRGGVDHLTASLSPWPAVGRIRTENAAHLSVDSIKSLPVDGQPPFTSSLMLLYVHRDRTVYLRRFEPRTVPSTFTRSSWALDLHTQLLSSVDG